MEKKTQTKYRYEILLRGGSCIRGAMTDVEPLKSIAECREAWTWICDADDCTIMIRTSEVQSIIWWPVD